MSTKAYSIMIKVGNKEWVQKVFTSDGPAKKYLYKIKKAHNIAVMAYREAEKYKRYLTKIDKKLEKHIRLDIDEIKFDIVIHKVD